jgi:4-amino-4-deoxy-L-arabinose transferase-like glycosyltransferase
MSLAVLSVLSLVLLLLCLGKSRRRYSLVMVLQLAMIFTYTWSLGENLRVLIHVTPSGVIADIGGNIRHLRLPRAPLLLPGARTDIHQPPAPLRIGLYSGTTDEYVVDPIGGPGFPGIAGSFKPLAQSLRFLTPISGWSHVTISYPHRTGRARIGINRLQTVSGTWGTNVRGELAGSFGAVGLIPHRVTTGYFTFSANLLRPDGLQGVLIGSSLPRHGYLLSIRMDERQAWFTAWRGPGRYRWNQVSQPTPLFPIRDNVMVVQYVLRTFLPSLILALALLLLAVPAFQTALAIGRISGRSALRVSRSGRDDKIQTAVVKATRAVRRPVRIPSESILMRASDVSAVGLAVAGAAVMGWLAGFAYQRVPSTQDTVGDLFQANTFALGRLWAPVPTHYWFFGQYSVLSLYGHWFAKYPPGWPMALAVGVVLHVPWLVNPVVSGIGILTVYLIGKELFGRKVGLLAEALALSSPFVLFIGSGFYAEPITWTFVGLYAYLLLVWRRRTRDGPAGWSALNPSHGPILMCAGLALGMAAMSRPLDALALGAPFLLLMGRRPLNLIWLALGAAVPTALYVTYSILVANSWIPNGHSLADNWDRPGFGQGVGGPAGTYFSNFTPQVALSNIATSLENFHLSSFGWPYFIAIAIVLLPFVLGRPRRGDMLLALAGLSLVFAYWFYWGTAVIQSSFPRYWYALVPLASLLAARGFQELYRLPLLSLVRMKYRCAAAAVAPAALLSMLLSFNLTVYTPSLAAAIHSWNDQNAAPINAVARAHLHHAIVFQVQNVGNWWPYGCVFDQNSPLLNGNVIWAQDHGWLDRMLMADYPYRSYYRLDNTTLTRLTWKSAAKKPPKLATGEGHQECGAVFSLSQIKKNPTPAPGILKGRPIPE